MGNVIGLPPVVVRAESENPARRQIQLRSRVFAILFTAALALAIAFTLLLCGTVLFYDGPLLAFGPGGVWIAPTSGEAANLLPLTAFTFTQRLVGAFALLLLSCPAIFIFFHLRALFQLYAKGVVFAQQNASHIKSIGTGLIAFSYDPACRRDPRSRVVSHRRSTGDGSRRASLCYRRRHATWLRD